MQIFTSWATLIAMVILSLTPAASKPATLGAAQANQVGIYSIAACRDTTTVTVSGSSIYATNRIVASVSYWNNDDAKYVLLQQTTSFNFGSGNFWIPIVLDYHTTPVDAGTSLQVIVQLQRSTGSGFTNLGASITTFVTAADHYCLNQCSVSISTGDRAPVSGMITLRSHFGSWFRPEGWLHGVTYVNAGQAVQATFADVACNTWVRVWFYPSTGIDRTPRMLPAQLWPNEFGTPAVGSPAPYATSFAKGLRATKPLESDDPYAPR
jgi:hypothetical protein